MAFAINLARALIDDMLASFEDYLTMFKGASLGICEGWFFHDYARRFSGFYDH